ncbi:MULTISPECIES: sulfotransferase domain-containing protein [Gammaproteobacteria]|uniref:sulfotransferase domain-containing protein n=1 Tax=Gammaproteobacteria TaxID=1236 RepID=UPI000DD0A119|nr:MULTISPECIES: sulfotransferase domain-containing protein [Gammaproteobacteria]RTE86086.1 hypothetical protein DQX04_05810 [Aliidiomarina sp. B3213]TCZ91440.1 hypothetical protein EYQ95_05820 [Lysobacter sp. N42]
MNVGCWLASYPKSGNTWLRVVLSAAFQLTQESKIPEQVLNIKNSEGLTHRSQLESILGLPLKHLDSKQFRTAIYHGLKENMCRNRTHFHKTHEQYFLDELRVISGGELPVEKVIYCVRNPVDVAVSFSEHMDTGYERACETLCGNQSGNTKYSISLPYHLGSWQEHVESWTLNTKHILVVRYEDLCDKPLEEYRKVLDFVEFNVSDEQLKEIVQLATFSNLQRNESQHGFLEKPTRLRKFFNKGVVGRGKELLSDDLQQKITSANRRVMERFGYL